VAEHVVIAPRFSGPPGSANGGYACGIVASLLGAGTIEATLRRPPPLDTHLTVVRPGDGQVQLFDGTELVAEGATVSLDIAPPPPVDVAAAEVAATRYRGLEPGGTYPWCFVCGTAREDGLRIFAGPVPGRDLVAAPWIPDDSVTEPSGLVPREIVWAALDCPTFFAATEPGTIALLGRMTAALFDDVHGGERHVVVARRVSADGRKRIGSSALYTEAGDLRAVALATWITIAFGDFPAS